MDEYEVLLAMQGYQSRMDDWSERLALFVAPLYNVHVSKRKDQKQSKDFFDREALKQERIKAAESKDPEDIKRRRRQQIGQLKKIAPTPRKHRKN